MKLCVLAVSVCVLAVRAPPARAQRGFWPPDDRILITSFLNARGIATDQHHVWVATELGLEIYDAAFKRWLPPSTVEDGYPVMERPARLAYDSRQRLLWLLTETQTLYSFSPPMQSWERRFESDISPEMRERLQRNAEPRDLPWTIVRRFISRDAIARQWPVTGVEPAERSDTYWAALLGGNFAFVDTRNLSAESQVFGTISRGVSAIAIDARGNLYFGGDGQSRRNGIARADSTLQRWAQYESRVGEGPRDRVHAMAASGEAAYAGASDGVFMLRGERWQRIGEGDVHALATTPDRVWVGTRGTLGWLDGSGKYTRVEFPVQDVYGLATRGDTLWVAASGGLYQYANDVLTQAITSRTFGVAATRDEIVAVTDRGIIMRATEGWVEVPPHASYATIGRFISIKASNDRVWFGGTNGLAEWQPATNTWRHLRVPADIPEGPIYDVVQQNGRLWLATPAGALGLQWK